jgi:hypothetical protein
MTRTGRTLRTIRNGGASAEPLELRQFEESLRRWADAVGDGDLELYESTVKYDGDIGRG